MSKELSKIINTDKVFYDLNNKIVVCRKCGEELLVHYLFAEAQVALECKKCDLVNLNIDMHDFKMLAFFDQDKEITTRSHYLASICQSYKKIKTKIDLRTKIIAEYLEKMGKKG